MPFAGYGFNQGHATAYADVSYRSAYLKTHYPAEFLAARLADYGGFHHPAIYMAEAVRLGIPIRPPHVNFSGEAVTLVYEEGGTVGDRPRQEVFYLGLGQVRDLRQNTIAAIIAERTNGAFTDIRDLLARVDLQPKETDHLIRAGGLDGLGESRAVLLTEAEQIRRAGGAAQLAFDFGGPEVPRESAAERLAWEQELLGLPVSVHPLQLVAERLPNRMPLRELPNTRRQIVTVGGVRLPGWTGGPGFFLGDGDTFIQVKPPRTTKAPPSWKPVQVRGRWANDEWGSGWLQADEII
jgi:DNA polymerase III alpha subunit